MTGACMNAVDLSTLLQENIETTIDRFRPAGNPGCNCFIPMAFIDEYSIKILSLCSRKPSTFEEIGIECVNAAHQFSNYKFGENRAKLLEQLGLLYIDREGLSTAKTTKLGETLLLFEKTTAIRIMVRLTIMIPVVNSIISSRTKYTDLRTFFPENFSESTIKRRCSSLLHIISDIRNEYRCTLSTEIILSDDPKLNEATKPLNDYYEKEEVSKDTTDTTTTVEEAECIDNKDSYENKDEINNATKNDNPVTNTIIEAQTIDMITDEDNLELITKISGFIDSFYKIDKKSKIKPLYETLINIIDDPSSNWVIQTISYLPIGYLVKYARNTEESVKECEYAALAALTCIYDVNIDLVILNLSQQLPLELFYDLKEKIFTYYSGVFDKVSNLMGIDDFIHAVNDNINSEKFNNEIKQLHISESNLYLRLAKWGVDLLSEDDIVRSLHIISQSRLEYPEDGISDKEIPLLFSTPVTHNYNSLVEIIFLEINVNGTYTPLKRMIEYIPNYWQDRIKELITLSYILSPHRITNLSGDDLKFVLSLSIADKIELIGDEAMNDICDDLLASFYHISGETQIKIISRVNLSNVINLVNPINPTSAFVLAQDDNNEITRLCLIIDKKIGRDAKYKSRIGLSSSLYEYEKMDLDAIIKYRNHTDSERSRNNRYINRIRYEYDSE